MQTKKIDAKVFALSLARKKMKIIQRKGTLIFWLVKEQIVIEFRFPILIWRTNEKSKIEKKGGKKINEQIKIVRRK